MPVGFARALAGTGRENLVDGPTETSAFSQPSGVCIAGGVIYVADSEVSAIRAIDMAGERVSTVIGQGLFYFGDEDGAHPNAKLQHPLGVAAWGSVLLVADTYNHKIKVVDPKGRTVRSLYGTGAPGVKSNDGGPAFFEPGGLSVMRSADGRDILFVADTNNHRIVRIDLHSSEWCEVSFAGLTAPTEQNHGASLTVIRPASRELQFARTAGHETQRSRFDHPSETVRLNPIDIVPGRDIELVIDVALPDGAHLNTEAPCRVRVSAHGTTITEQTGAVPALPFKLLIPANAVVANCDWTIGVDLTCCSDADGLCIPISKSGTLYVNGPPPQVIPISL